VSDSASYLATINQSHGSAVEAADRNAHRSLRANIHSNGAAYFCSNIPAKQPTVFDAKRTTDLVTNKRSDNLGTIFAAIITSNVDAINLAAEFPAHQAAFLATVELSFREAHSDAFRRSYN
jgi:hypothetical protein